MKKPDTRKVTYCMKGQICRDRMQISGGQGMGGMRANEIAHSYRVSFQGDRNVMKLVIQVAQHCEYT